MRHITMTKDGKVIPVHPTCVREHQQLGWKITDTPPPAKEEPATPRPAPAQDGPVTIPENWRELSWPQRKSLASRLTDTPIVNGNDANAAIELEIERRAS